MWTKKIIEIISDGRADGFYHFLSSIVCSLSWCIMLHPFVWTVIAAPILGFLTMLVWELAQWKWDSGFSTEDIVSNGKGAFFSLFYIGAIFILKSIL